MPRQSRQPDGAAAPARTGQPGRPQRRSYDHYCGAARALDAVGDRWSLLIVRELLGGARRYTDLHADLPGVSTDVLASRLRDLEREGVAVRRRLPPPASAAVYELTDRGRRLLPVLEALCAWGAEELAERRPTDAVRAHWFALPLRGRLAALGGVGVAEVHVDEGVFHVFVGQCPEGGSPPGALSAAGSGGEPGAVYGDGPAPGEPDALLRLDSATCAEVVAGALGVGEAVRSGRLLVDGDGPLAKALLGAGGRHQDTG
ncbi:transcriptional regulator [Streptomyces sp. TS71-3]|nr:helix-turn-helix domain-containing protein [Streptomyces sp. TS71-3]GHJ41118.1 transcriptional regulator [Streptomyces sp. TS71-3]